MFVDAEIVAQVLLDLRRGSSVGIAIGIEQAGLGREQRALPVHVDRAALEHDPRVKDGQAELLRRSALGMTSSRSYGGYLPPQAL